jgi:hypothetical protein
MKTKLWYVLLLIVNFNYAQNFDNWIWAKIYGDNYIDNGNSITSDGKNIYVCGRYVNSINFGNGWNFATYVSTPAGFLLKTDNNGNTIWAKNYFTNNATNCTIVRTDNINNILMCGFTAGNSLSFGSTTLSNPTPGQNMFFVVKMDTTGNAIWANPLPPSTYTISNLVTDNNNNIYLFGSFKGKYFVIGNDSLKNSDTSGMTRDLFILKLNSNGTKIWMKSYFQLVNNAPVTEIGYGLCENKNALYILFGYGNNNRVTALSSNSGSIKWTKEIVNSSCNQNSIAVQKNKNRLVFVVNTLTGFGNTNSIIDNYILNQPYIVISDSSGNIENIKYPSNVPSTKLISVFTDNTDNIYLTGTNTGTANVGGINFTYGVPFIVMYNDNLNFAYWGATIQTNSNGIISDVVLDNSKNVYVFGNTGSNISIKFGNINLIKTNSIDIFLAKIDGMVNVSENYKSNTHFLVYPNPSSGTIYLKSSLNHSKIKIYNVLGQIVLESIIEKDELLKFDLNPGVYFVQDEISNSFVKLVVQ